MASMLSTRPPPAAVDATPSLGAMDLRAWILDDFDATTARLRAQVLDIVPVDRRREQPGGGNSIVWGCFHVARHIDAALTVVTGAKPEFGGWESDFDEP